METIHVFDQILFEVGGALVALASDKVYSIASADNMVNGGRGNIVTPATAETIRQAVTRLGPNFVKIGQALASRPDLVGEAIAAELLLLQDAMPPFPNDVAMELIHQVSNVHKYQSSIYHCVIHSRNACISCWKPDDSGVFLQS